MIELTSYLEGRWVAGVGDAEALVNPATEEVLATSSTAGLDLAGALQHARSVGNPRMRALTFKQRGELLRALSKSIHGMRDALLAEETSNGGNTYKDGKFDVDGAWGTLAAYADIADSLGDGTILPDGDSIQLGRSPRLHGLHVRVPRAGVAVLVNAFNFPAWGMAEKAATAILAGMPIFAKPAGPTALVAWRIAKAWAEHFPEGAFSFLAGAPHDLVEHLDYRDALSFTGSSGTGARLRASTAVTQGGVALAVEADSLNAAVLGPDVEMGSELLDLFVADVVREVTQKAGQKCTAFRRIFVPKTVAAEVTERLAAELGRAKVGNPADAGITMGPLTTSVQLAGIRERLPAFTKGATIAFGSETSGESRGYFFGPMLLSLDTVDDGDLVHHDELFAPIATVIAYDGTAAEAARGVILGRGGLQCSVYSDDKTFLRSFVLGVAPHHGRVSIGSSKIAGQAMAPGMALPQLLHGGPGRAGGAEELGGLRGCAFYTQRVALQGDRALLFDLAGLG